MDKKKIIREKSVYKRKKSYWDQVKDEIYLKWILFMLEKNNPLFCRSVRPSVRVLLQKHGKLVEDVDKSWWKIS